MEYITLDDIKDRILNCTQDDVDAGNNHIIRLAGKRGVSVAEIVAPTPVVITRLGVVYACYNRAMCNVGSDATTMLDGSSEDVYALKRKTYLDELKRLESDILAEDFTGKPKGGSAVGVINLSRG